jgi:hypothetical protein
MVEHRAVRPIGRQQRFHLAAEILIRARLLKERGALTGRVIQGGMVKLFHLLPLFAIHKGRKWLRL